MADKKISQLPQGEYTPQSIFPFVSFGVTSQNTFAGLVDALSPYFSGGTGGGIIEVDKAELDDIISDAGLIAGSTYKITGTHSGLYDDGSDSGTTIYLQALSDVKLAEQGFGEFYNPIYNLNEDGYGIWSNESTWDIGNPVVDNINFQINEPFQSDNGAFGTLVGSIQNGVFVGGQDLVGATYITGQNSGAQIYVSNLNIKTYSVNDNVIWGGYLWINLDGEVGDKNDDLNLNTSWSKIAYSNDDYNFVIDNIKYDYINDFIYYRESNNGIQVEYTKEDMIYFSKESTISFIQWGNSNNTSIGSFNNKIVNSFVSDINFRGQYNFGNSYNFCSFYNNYFCLYTSITSNQYRNGCNITNNNFGPNIEFYSNVFGDEMDFESNSISFNNQFSFNIFNNGCAINGNILDGDFTYNVLWQNVNLTDNNLGSGSEMSGNIFNSDMTYGENNHINQVNIIQNIFGANCNFIDNEIADGVSLRYNSFNTNSQIMFNIFDNALNEFSNITIDNGVNISGYNFDTSTLLSGAYQKTIYIRPDNTIKLRYFNDNDTLVIADITE